MICHYLVSVGAAVDISESEYNHDVLMEVFITSTVISHSDGMLIEKSVIPICFFS